MAAIIAARVGDHQGLTASALMAAMEIVDRHPRIFGWGSHRTEFEVDDVLTATDGRLFGSGGADLQAQEVHSAVLLVSRDRPRPISACSFVIPQGTHGSLLDELPNMWR
jgi:hypothetical protein